MKAGCFAIMSYRCIVTIHILWLFLTGPWFGLLYVIVDLQSDMYLQSDMLPTALHGPAFLFLFKLATFDSVICNEICHYYVP